jgi:hypothetical protein
MHSPATAVSTYFLAKDGNRPFLMRRAFATDAELEMIVKTEGISFPGSARGVQAIEDILGRRFANDFENVYTFGLAQPSEANRRHFPCPWLVGMSGKNNGPIRVGCGRYDWYFTPDEDCLVEKLVITIDVMQVLQARGIEPIMDWLCDLPYPWCTPDEALRQMPGTKELNPVRSYLSEVRALTTR